MVSISTCYTQYIVDLRILMCINSLLHDSTVYCMMYPVSLMGSAHEKQGGQAPGKFASSNTSATWERAVPLRFACSRRWCCCWGWAWARQPGVLSGSGDPRVPGPGCLRCLLLPVEVCFTAAPSSLLDYKGTEIMYPVEDDRDQWWARRLEDTVNHHRDLAERDLDGLQPTLSMLCGGCSKRWKRRSVVSVLREMSITIAAPEAVFPQNYANLCENELH